MDDEQRIADHLRTLSICHYVYAALATCFSCLGGFYIAMGAFFGEIMKAAPKQNGSAPPPEVADMFTFMFTGIGAAIVVAALTVAVLCVLSGRGMMLRRRRTLSLVVAGILCLTGPLGIALGVFTFIVLLKPETERLYAEAPPAV